MEGDHGCGFHTQLAFLAEDPGNHSVVEVAGHTRPVEEEDSGMNMALLELEESCSFVVEDRHILAVVDMNFAEGSHHHIEAVRMKVVEGTVAESNLAGHTEVAADNGWHYHILAVPDSTTCSLSMSCD